MLDNVVVKRIFESWSRVLLVRFPTLVTLRGGLQNPCGFKRVKITIENFISFSNGIKYSDFKTFFRRFYSFCAEGVEKTFILFPASQPFLSFGRPLFSSVLWCPFVSAFQPTFIPRQIFLALKWFRPITFPHNAFLTSINGKSSFYTTRCSHQNTRKLTIVL